jgi:hypothetical protein
VLGQLMPAGLEVTVPRPAPPIAAVIVYCRTANAASTVAAAVSATVHVPVPLQPPPLQPVNVPPAPPLAVSVTIVPWS